MQCTCIATFLFHILLAEDARGHPSLSCLLQHASWVAYPRYAAFAIIVYCRPGVENPRRVFVGNLDPATTEEELRAWADGVGPVESVEVVQSRPGRARGHGYVSFVDEATARRAAAEFNGSDLKGREVSVEAARPPRVRAPRPVRERSTEDAKPTNRLYVGNLPFEVDEAGLADLFAGIAGVTGTEIARRANEASKGWGYVQFGSVEEASAALAAIGTKELGGRQLRIENEAGRRRRPRGPRTNGGAGGAGGEADGEGRTRRRRRARDDDDAEYTFEGDPCRVFVANLPWSTDEAALVAAFPGAVSAEVLRTRDGSRSRGKGYVVFSTPEAASAATESNVVLEERELRVELERRRVRVEA